MINMTKYLVGLVAACIVLVALNCASATEDELFDLKSLVTAFEDVRMNSQDLAFYLATHGYNAAPKNGYVELSLYGQTYRLTPNGNGPGLCDIELEILG
jgi:hypothetical protein